MNQGHDPKPQSRGGGGGGGKEDTCRACARSFSIMHTNVSNLADTTICSASPSCRIRCRLFWTSPAWKSSILIRAPPRVQRCVGVPELRQVQEASGWWLAKSNRICSVCCVKMCYYRVSFSQYTTLASWRMTEKNYQYFCSSCRSLRGLCTGNDILPICRT